MAGGCRWRLARDEAASAAVEHLPWARDGANSSSVSLSFPSRDHSRGPLKTQGDAGSNWK